MPPSQQYPSPQAEAARYALLRRLASSMRHHLVVNLQPIGMICEVMDRRLRAPTPDLAHIHDSSAKINAFARAALTSSADVVGWLAPDEAATIPVEEAARECASLLATSFSFRGYALRNEIRAVPGAVRRSAIRHALAASLIHCTDRQPAPADLLLTAAADGDGVRVSIAMRPTPGDASAAGEANYRKLAWSDVQALAAADGVQVAQEGDALVLRFACVA